MKLTITQNVKYEIERNLALHTKLVELINNTKTTNGITELDDSYLDVICREFKTGRYSFDDLTYCIPNLVDNQQISESDGALIVQALCAVNDENEEYFLDDSNDLKELIKKLYFEILILTQDERKNYFDTNKRDKYYLYLYHRAVPLIGVQNAFL